MLTEKVKTFIEILYLIIRYGPLRVMREFPGKRGKTFGLDKLTTKLLKKWTSKRTHGVAYRGLCVSQRAPRSAVRYKACVLVNGGYFEHRMKC